MQSPYHPGTGARPDVLVGRDAVFSQAQALVERVRSTGRGGAAALVLVGVRGSGKTVSLDVIGERARAAGFVVAATTFSSVTNAGQEVARAVGQAMAPFQGLGAQQWERIRQWLAGWNVEVSAGVVKVSGNLAGDSKRYTVTAGSSAALADLLSESAAVAAERQGAGLLLLVDEVQEAGLEDLAVVANAIQLTVRSGAPLLVVAAGLPNAPAKLMKAASFAERFDYRELKRLTSAESEIALLRPAAQLEVGWAAEAAALALDFAAGSPYMIQKVGDEVWRVAGPRRGGRITHDHVTTAVTEVLESLASGMFKGRLEKATPAQRDFVVALAQSLERDGSAATSVVGARLGKTATQMSRDRQALIDKGLIAAEGYGRLSFTMPGFAEYVLSVVDDDAAAQTPTVQASQLPARPQPSLPSARGTDRSNPAR